MNFFKKWTQPKANQALAQDLINKTQEELAKVTPAQVVVAGKTGSGKSTLINALFREDLAQTGVGQPVTQHVERITKEGVPLVLYDTKGLELNPDTQHQVLLSLSSLVQFQQAKGPEEAIDVVYYCINSTMGRIEPFEIELIEAMSQHAPVIIVVTQAIGAQTDDFVNYLNKLSLPVKSVMAVLAKPYPIQGGGTIDSFGLKELVDLTLVTIPKEAHKAFINAQQVDLDLKVQEARRWAKRYIQTSFGVGFVPIPIADATLLIPMQITMLAHLTAIFGLSLNKAQIVSMIAGMGGTGTTTYVGKFVVSSALKLIPAAGPVSQGLISGMTASALTITLAYAYIEVLRHIAVAEVNGRDLKLQEIQSIMNKSLSEQLDMVANNLPNELKGTLLPKWLGNFVDKR